LSQRGSEPSYYIEDCRILYLNYKTETTLMLLSSCDAATVVCAVVVLL
jgi:hypothetical protein